MRSELTEIIKIIGSISNAPAIRVTGTDDKTRFEAYDESKDLYIDAKLKSPIVDLEGVFSLTRLNFLSGVLNFASYKTDNSSTTIVRDVRQGKEIPVSFIFKDENGEGTTYRLAGPESSNESQPENAVNKFEIEFEPVKSKIQEFSQLASLHSSSSEASFFTVNARDGKLLFQLGHDSNSTDSSSMVFQDDVTGSMKTISWSISLFLSALKVAGSYNPLLRFSNRNVMRIDFETEQAYYSIYIIAKV